MAYDFKGKKILVTGGGRNIGRGIVKQLAELGATVFVLDRIQEDLDNLVAEIPSVIPICQDLEKWDETAKTVGQLDTMDGLVNCAGLVGNRQKATSVPKEELYKIQSVNLMAPINLMQIVGKKMADGGKGGSIVNISSQVSMFAFGGLLPYCVSKAGLDMATKMFALELGPRNVRVNSVNPGNTHITMVAAMTGEMTDKMESLIPLGRSNEIEDVVDLVVFLLSDKSKMITGTNNIINGGLTCQLPTG